MMPFNNQPPGGSQPSWICCQLGAREHYSVPRALHKSGLLSHLVADAWVPGSHPLRWFRPSLRERFHPSLKSAHVLNGNLSLSAFELLAKLQGLSGWPLTLARNKWFQRMAVRRLKTLRTEPGPKVLFAYSYAALDILSYARSQGWRTVLGQIDPGPDSAHLEKLCSRHGGGFETLHSPPDSYWDSWRKECDLADDIIVNSEWSRHSLVESGIDGRKIQVIPLVIQNPAGSMTEPRTYPARFDAQRPLRVLFLGQITARKGVLPTLQAARLLAGEPVEFWMAGAERFDVGDELRSSPGVRWVGKVDRSGTAKFYQEADVFLFPSFSDGFGLTQLEAQSLKLPVIASRYCGAVVRDGQNGALLPNPSAEAIADVIRVCLKEPQVLARWSEHAVSMKEFGIDVFGERLRGIVARPPFVPAPNPSKPVPSSIAASHSGRESNSHKGTWLHGSSTTVPVSAIVTAYERPIQTVTTIEKLQACEPPPFEILVHVDGGRPEVARLLHERFPKLQVLESEVPLGPGGSRNRLLKESSCEWVASFDDDSYPMDGDFFGRLSTTIRAHPEAAVISAFLISRGESAPPPDDRAYWVADFVGAACVYQREVFLKIPGYVPLRVAYGMEEVDLALRLREAGLGILESRSLRIFHDTDYSHRMTDSWLAGAVSNIALHAFLRYPPAFWPLGLAQLLGRSLNLIKQGRWRGVCRGLAQIPRQCLSFSSYRNTVSMNTLTNYRRLRKMPMLASEGAVMVPD